MIYVNYDSEMQDGRMMPVICKNKLYPAMAKQCIFLNITPADYGPKCTPDLYGPHHRFAHIVHCPIRPEDTPEAMPAKRKIGEMQASEPQERLTLQQHLYQSRGVKNCLSAVRFSVTGCNFKLLKRQEWIRLLTSYGAAFAPNLSIKTTHLLVGPNPTAAWKVLQAEKMGIKIVNEYGAFDLISTSQPTAPLSSIHEEEEWVGWDSCSKWRKVPSNFRFHRNQNFFCHMIPLMTCDVQEEEWDEKEPLVELKGDAAMPWSTSPSTPVVTSTRDSSLNILKKQDEYYYLCPLYFVVLLTSTFMKTACKKFLLVHARETFLVDPRTSSPCFARQNHARQQVRSSTNTALSLTWQDYQDVSLKSRTQVLKDFKF